MIRSLLDRLGARLEALPRWALPVAVGAVAALVRAWVLVEQRAGNPLLRLAILDDRGYLDMAAAVGRGEMDGPWFLAPLYPYVLAAVSLGGAPDMLTASIVNVVAGTLTCVLAALCARSLHSTAAGWLAGALTALAGTFVFHDVLPGQEPLLCLLHVAGFWVAIRWLRTGNLRAAAGLGAVAGVAALGRGTSLAIVAGAALVVLARRRSTPRAISGVGVAALMTIAVLVPASLRNHAASGSWSPLPPKAGVDLYMSNNPVAREGVGFGAPELGMAPERMAVAWRRSAEDAAGGPLTAGEIDTYWLRRTWAEHGTTGELAGHGVRKALLFFAASEYGSNHYVALERRFATWLTFVPVSGWWLLALGIGGWWLVRRRLPAADAALVTMALTWAALTVFYPVSRYRLPVLPLAAILGAAGLVEAGGREAWRGALRRRSWTALGLVVVVTAVACADRLIRPPPQEAVAWVNLSTAHARVGDDAAAEGLLRETVERWPSDGPAHFELARLLLRSDRAAESLPHIAAAGRDTRTRVGADVVRIGALLGTGDADAAERLGATLFERMPPVPGLRAEMLAWWALTAHALGDPVQARRRLDAAQRLDPGNDVVQRAERTLR